MKSYEFPLLLFNWFFLRSSVFVWFRKLGLKFAILTTFHTPPLPACEVILFLANARQAQILPEFSTLNESGVGALELEKATETFATRAYLKLQRDSPEAWTRARPSGALPRKKTGGRGGGIKKKKKSCPVPTCCHKSHQDSSSWQGQIYVETYVFIYFPLPSGKLDSYGMCWSGGA